MNRFIVRILYIIWFFGIGMIVGALKWDKEQYSESKTFERNIVKRKVSKMKTTRRIITVAVCYSIVSSIAVVVLNCCFRITSIPQDAVWQIALVAYFLLPVLYWLLEVFCAQHRRRIYQTINGVSKSGKTKPER